MEILASTVSQFSLAHRVAKRLKFQDNSPIQVDTVNYGYFEFTVNGESYENTHVPESFITEAIALIKNENSIGSEIVMVKLMGYVYVELTRVAVCLKYPLLVSSECHKYFYLDRQSDD